MFPDSIDPIKRGERIKASWLNKLRDAASRSLKIKAEAPLEAIRTAGGWVIRLAMNPLGYFWIRITGGNQPYAWQEVLPAANGTWQGGPRSGTTGNDPAYEQNNNRSVNAGLIVVARRSTSARTVIFQMAVCTTGQTSPPVTPGPTPAPPTGTSPPPTIAPLTGGLVPQSYSGFPGSTPPPGTGANSIQTITGDAAYATGDQWSVSWNGNNSGPILFGDNLATVQAALEAITGIGTGNLSLTGFPSHPTTPAHPMSWQVEFIGPLGNQAQNAFTQYVMSPGDSLTITQTQVGHP